MSACSLSKHTTWHVRRRQLPVLLTVCLASLVALRDTASDGCPESAVRIHVDPGDVRATCGFLLHDLVSQSKSPNAALLEKEAAD